MIAELRITPVQGADFVSDLAGVVQVLAESPLSYQVHAMGTTLEGELDQILDVVRRCHEQLRKRSGRVLVELSIDDRESKEGELVRSLEHLRSATFAWPLERYTHMSPEAGASGARGGAAKQHGAKRPRVRASPE